MHIYLLDANLNFKFDFYLSTILLSNLYHKYLPLLATFSFMICIALSMQVKAQDLPNNLIEFEGRVLSADSLLPLHNTHIISKFNHWGSISNFDGTFKMYVSKYDSVLITTVGYSPKILYVDDSIISQTGPEFRIYMSKDTVMINEVLIRAFYDYETFKQLVINMEPLNLDQFYPEWEGSELLYMQPTPTGFKGPTQIMYDWLNRDARLQRQMIKTRKQYNDLMRKLNRHMDTIPPMPEHMQGSPR